MGCQCQKHQSKDEPPGVAYVCFALSIGFWLLTGWSGYAFVTNWTLLSFVGLVVFAVIAWVTTTISVDIVRQYNNQLGRSKEK